MTRRATEASDFPLPDADPSSLPPELRSLRLQQEYLGAEIILAEHGIGHVVVVFGGARLQDPERAQREVTAAQRALARAPDNELAAASLRRAEQALERSRFYEIGRALGRIVGSLDTRDDHPRLAIMTGGGPGAMEAANRGAFEVGGASIGLNISLPREQQANAYITPGLSLHFRYFALRKLHFMLRARALVALPGGYGTLDECFETLCLIQTGKRDPLPVVLIGESFWRRAIDFEFLLEQGMIDPSHLELFRYAESAESAWETIVAWYAERGRSVFDGDREIVSARGE